MEGVFVISSAVNLLSEGAVDDLARTLENRGDIRSLVVLQKEDAEKSEESSNVSRLIHMLNESSMSEEPMIDPTSKKPVQVIHFTGLPEFSVPLEGEGESLHEAFNDMLAEGVFEALPENGTTVLRPDVLTDELVEKIWKIYDKQLDILIEDHPAYQRLDRQLVEDMLRSPTGFNIVHFVDSEPVSIFLGVTDMQTCEWLNAKLISSRYPEDTLYCPAMVTDFDKQGLNYSSNVFKLLTSVALKRGKNIRPYFECTDISAGYIPGILTKSLNETGVATIEVVEQERYKYRRLVRIPSTA
jgi:hypothetical protein